jgi:hypothetical protein
MLGELEITPPYWPLPKLTSGATSAPGVAAS